jgi:hypothetical protein
MPHAFTAPATRPRQSTGAMYAHRLGAYSTPRGGTLLPHTRRWQPPALGAPAASPLTRLFAEEL